MTLIVNQLETFDRSNLEVIRIEFAKLQKKLEQCQEDQEIIKPDIGKIIVRRLQVVVFKIRYCHPMSTFFFSFQATAITQES